MGDAEPTALGSGELMVLVRETGILCLNVGDPGWDDARGYSFDGYTGMMYFPVAKKYLVGDLSRFQVLIWSQPRVIVEGELRPATTEQDVRTQLSLAERKGIDAVKARYMVFDSRTKKPRRTLYKLVIREVSLAAS